MSTDKDSHIVATIKEYGKSLLSFIRRRVKNDAEAEDILQEVWYQFSSLVNAEAIEQTGAWLYKVARNKIIDNHKKKAPQLISDLQDDDDDSFDFTEILLIESSTPETEYLRTIFWKQFFEALEELREDQRQIFIWHELEGLSFAEISEITGEKTNTLISRKRYAVLHLRNRLKLLKDEIFDY